MELHHGVKRADLLTVDFTNILPKYSKFRSKVRQVRCEVQSSY